MAQAQGGPASVRQDEVDRFDRLAGRWWDPKGPMAALHAMNGLRTGWIERRVLHAWGPGAAVLDVGCGAGLLAEALARRGFDVLGLDAAAEAVAAARAHAEGEELPLEYRVGAAEELLAEGRRFPVVTALEVIEHVREPAGFLRTLAGLLLPGGMLFVSTVNRTAKSLLMAKIGAEYVVRLLPVGTHEWRRFVTPGELGAAGRGAGLRLEATAGMRFNPLRGSWAESRDLGVNYIAVLRAAGTAR